MDPRIEELRIKGVSISSPESVELGPGVHPDRIAEGVVLHPGCRIRGASTVILHGAVLGEEGPVTVEDCQVGPGVELKGGYFRKSVFLEKASLGSGAQVREACLLEEEASGGHTVGLKQTILFPFVTLGSLINFCDVLMAGGTSRRDHSEVGSSYVHFNYTPNQDKATPSILGDVPRGVMLRERPVFLGGQGGLAGPVEIGYGSVIAAGIVQRRDVGEGLLVTGGAAVPKETPFLPGVYFEIQRKVLRNLRYIGNLAALRRWYLDVRRSFLQGGALEQALHAGAVEKVDMALEERIARLRAVAEKMPESLRRLIAARGGAGTRLAAQKEEFHMRWPEVEPSMRATMEAAGAGSARDAFLEAFARASRPGYIETVRALDDATRLAGTAWLQAIVDEVVDSALAPLPTFRRPAGSADGR